MGNQAPCQRKRQEDDQGLREGHRFFGTVPADDAGNRIPCGMQQSTMRPEVLEFIREECEMFHLGTELTRSSEFQRCVDYPSIPKHVYFEGYFHALPQSKPVLSMSPRTMDLISKPALPVALRAFIEVQRRRLGPRLIKAMEGQIGESFDILRKVIEEHRLFSDIAVQIHAGDEVPEENIGWHTDAGNSVLHMAISIHGHRTVHSVRSDERLEKPSQPQATGRSRLQDGEDYHVVAEDQEPGDVYISSPAIFTHGVQYPRAKWKKRAIAVQCRILFDDIDDLSMFQVAQFRDATERRRLLDCVTSALLEEPLELPTLEEVQDAMVLLQEHSTVAKTQANSGSLVV